MQMQAHTTNFICIMFKGKHSDAECSKKNIQVQNSEAECSKENIQMQNSDAELSKKNIQMQN